MIQPSTVPNMELYMDYDYSTLSNRIQRAIPFALVLRQLVILYWWSPEGQFPFNSALAEPCITCLEW